MGPCFTCAMPPELLTASPCSLAVRPPVQPLLGCPRRYCLLYSAFYNVLDYNAGGEAFPGAGGAGRGEAGMLAGTHAQPCACMASLPARPPGLCSSQLVVRRWLQATM